MAEETAIPPSEGKERPHSFKEDRPRIHRGVIVEVISVEQAKIAEETGACGIFLSERMPRGILRAPQPLLFMQIIRAVSIPVIVKLRSGRLIDAQTLESIGLKKDFDGSDEASAEDEKNFIKRQKLMDSYFVCGCRSLGESLRTVKEGGAATGKTLGDMRYSPTTVAETLRGAKFVMAEIRYLLNAKDNQLLGSSQMIAAPYDLIKETRGTSKLPATNYAVEEIETPADAALLMQIGCDGIFLGLDIFTYSNPRDRIRRMVLAVKNYNNPEVLAQVTSIGSGFTQVSDRNVSAPMAD